MRLGTLMAIALVAVFVLVLAVALASKRKPVAGKVKGRAFLTANELEFLNRLEAAVPEVRFHSQVAMGALLEPAFAKKVDPRAYMSIRGSFSQKVVDFVAQDRGSGAVLAVIELDDRTHHATKDNKRDEMLREGGYKVVRWQSTAKPDAAAIRDALVATTSQGAALPLISNTAMARRAGKPA
jgi:hypothetical protein